MNKRTQTVNLRLGVQDAEKLKDALRSIGEDGEKMAKAIDRSSKEANTGLKALDTAADQAKTSVEGLADRAGVLSGPLKALGPSGLTAAAGFGALVVSFGAAVRTGREAVATFSDIGNAADALSLSAETYQALGAQADALGLSITSVDTAMRSLSERQSQIITQEGELYSKLKDTHPELLRRLAALDNNEDRLRAVAKAYGEAETAIERARISFAAFGGAGEDVSKILDQTGGDIDALIAGGRALGLVLEDDLIRRSQDLATEMDIASQVIDLQLKQAFVDFAPIALGATKQMAELSEMAARVAENFREASLRSSEFNNDRLLDLSDRLEGSFSSSRLANARSGGTSLSIDEVDTQGLRRGRILALRAQIDEFNELLTIEAGRTAEALTDNYRRALAGMTVEALEEAYADAQARLEGLEARRETTTDADGIARLDTAISQAESDRDVAREQLEAAKARQAHTEAIEEQRGAEERLKTAEADAARRARELDRLRRQAAKLLLDLGDATLALVLKQEELNEVVEAGFITTEQAAEILQRYEDEVTGVSDAIERWTSVADGALTPTEEINRQIAELTADFDAGKIGEGAEALKLYADALSALYAELNEEALSQQAGSDEGQLTEKIKNRVAELERASKSVAELIAEEEARVAQLVNVSITNEEAQAYLRDYAAQLRATRDEVGLLGRAETILDGIEQGRIRTVDDLGRAVSAMIIQIVRQAAMAQSQIGGGGGFGDFVGSVFSGIFGGSSAPGQTPPIVASGSVGQSHSGSIVGAGRQQIRALNTPLMRNERMMRVETGQEIITPGDRRRIIDYIGEASRDRAFEPMNAISGPMPLDIGIKVRTEGGSNAEVSATQTGDNEIEIDVLLLDKFRGAVAGGGLDSALEGRGFQKRSLR